MGRRGDIVTTPAMARGLTDHLGRVLEQLSSRRTPAALPPPKRGRPGKQALSHPSGTSFGRKIAPMARQEAPVASTMEEGTPNSLPVFLLEESTTLSEIELCFLYLSSIFAS